MSKQITPNELAEIVTGLLVKPDLLGELDSPDRHQSFMLDIGRVVAEHCGGEANWVNEAATNKRFLEDEENSPTLSVSPNDSLPSLHNNVWGCFDPAGWDDEDAKGVGIEAGKTLSKQAMAQTRAQLQSLLATIALAEDSAHSVAIELDMVDWRIADMLPLEQPGDDRRYRLRAELGNQSSLSFYDGGEEPCFSVMIEINRGVPALHIDPDGQEATLHIHGAQEGLVLTPSYMEARFEPAEIDRFSYSDTGSLVLR